MRTNEKWTSMLIFLEKEDHRKLKEISLEKATFPHRVLVETVKRYNTYGLPKWLVKACLRGQEISKSKSGRPRLDKSK